MLDYQSNGDDTILTSFIIQRWSRTTNSLSEEKVKDGWKQVNHRDNLHNTTLYNWWLWSSLRSHRISENILQFFLSSPSEPVRDWLCLLSLYNKIRKHSLSGPAGSNKNYRVDRQLNFTSNAIFLSISIKRNVNSLPTVPPPRYLSLHSEWVIYKVQENIFDRKVLHETI